MIFPLGMVHRHVGCDVDKEAGKAETGHKGTWQLSICLLKPHLHSTPAPCWDPRANPMLHCHLPQLLNMQIPRKQEETPRKEHPNTLNIKIKPHNISDDVLLLQQSKAQEQKKELSLWCMFWITTLSLLRGKKLLICCASMAKLFFLLLVFTGHCLNMVSICQWQGTKLRAWGPTAFHQELIYDAHLHGRCRSSFPHT